MGIGRADSSDHVVEGHLELDSLLGLDALLLVGVFDHLHLGDEVGAVDQLLGGVSAGDDDVQRVAPPPQSVDYVFATGTQP